MHHSTYGGRGQRIICMIPSTMWDVGIELGSQHLYLLSYLQGSFLSLPLPPFRLILLDSALVYIA